MKDFPASQLIINDDGSVFHLHLRPEQLAQKVLLVGDPGRVNMVKGLMDSVECEVQNREFHTITGQYRGKRLTCLSTGIGTDNIDIVMNELDALANIDLTTRTEKAEHTTLDIVRVGTCGGMQEDIPLGTFLASKRSIGFDGVLSFYAGRDAVSDLDFEAALVKHLAFLPKMAVPYVINNDEELLERVAFDMMKGCTIAANGFYGPQGRVLRCPIAIPDINEKVSSFRFGADRITNYEMEGSAIAGLSRLMGHHALTVCCVIAQRKAEAANTDYKPLIQQLLTTVVERI